MSESEFFERIATALVEGGPVRDLLRRSSRSYLTWDQFLASRLPDPLSPVQTWEVLKAIDHAAGIDLPIPDLEGRTYWYLRTHDIADSVGRIQCLCRADSSLYRRLTATQNRRVLVHSRIDETLAAAQLDGLLISVEQGADLLRSNRAPRNNTERIVRNTLAALDHLDELVGEPFSYDLLMHLRSLLLVGLRVDAWPVTPPRMGLMPSEYSDEQVREGSERQVRHICDYANHATGDPHDHPVMRALLLTDMFRFYRPLPCMNSQVGRLVFRLYALKVGLPVLGMLPISRAKLSWEDDALESPLVTLRPGEYFEAHRHFGTDLTGYMTLAVQLALTALQDLNWQIDDMERQDEELRSLLQQDPTINHRQRSVLGRALRNPTSEFRIATHKTTHSVVYATARADLLDLVERGYLEMVTRGRAFVFVPAPGMRALLEEHEGLRVASE